MLNIKLIRKENLKKQHELEQKYLEEEQRQRVADLELSAARRREDEVGKHEQAKLNAKIEEESRLREARDGASLKYLDSLKEKGVDLNDYFKSVATAFSSLKSSQESLDKGVFGAIAQSMLD